MSTLSWQDIDPCGKTCPLCGGKLNLRLRDVENPGTGNFDVMRCEGCGLGITDPMPGDLSPYYENYHGGRHGASAVRCNKRRISVLAGFTSARKPGSLLDIGCGDGGFLLAARKGGWRVLGTELNPFPARHRGIDVVKDIGEIPEGSLFDCITFWHSLEHLRDPLKILKSVRRRLAPKGVLLVAVPNFDGIQARLFGRRWFHLDVPRHLYHYNKTSLSGLLHATGFRPAWWRHQELEYDLIGWPQSALNCLLPTPNVFLDVLMGRTPACSAAEKLASVAAGAILTAFAVPLVAMGSFINRGATLIVAARPSEAPGSC